MLVTLDLIYIYSAVQFRELFRLRAISYVSETHYDNVVCSVCMPVCCLPSLTLMFQSHGENNTAAAGSRSAK